MSDAKFFDSYGTEVKDGTKILIEQNYNFRHFNNREAIVMWDQRVGMYRFKFIGEYLDHNFYGIAKFRAIGNEIDIKKGHSTDIE